MDIQETDAHKFYVSPKIMIWRETIFFMQDKTARSRLEERHAFHLFHFLKTLMWNWFMYNLSIP
jgi:hypothetical protein